MSAAAGALLVVAALAAAAVLARRRCGGGAASPLSLEARVALGKESGVALVRCGARTVLVGYGPSGVARLDVREEGSP